MICEETVILAQKSAVGVRQVVSDYEMTSYIRFDDLGLCRSCAH